MSTTAGVKVLRAGEGESVWAMGEKFTFKVGPAENRGAFSMMENIAQPQNGPPPHIHRREDEIFYVVDGEFSFVFNQSVFTRGSGSASFLPRNILHTYSNVGTKPAKLIVIAAPSGFENFIRSWSRPVNDSMELPSPPTQEDIDKLLAAAPGFGIELYPDAKPGTEPGPAEDYRSYWVLGQYVTVKLGSRQTDGQFSVAEVISPPGPGVPKHVHTFMDEVFYILDGQFEFEFKVGAQLVAAGDTVFVPHGQVHGFRNAAKGPSRLLDIHSPGGFEKFFEEAGTPNAHFSLPAPPIPSPDPAWLASLFQRHGMEIV